MKGRIVAVGTLGLRLGTDEAARCALIEALSNTGAWARAYVPVASHEAARVFGERECWSADFDACVVHWATVAPVQAIRRSEYLRKIKRAPRDAVTFAGRHFHDSDPLRDRGIRCYPIGRGARSPQ